MQNESTLPIFTHFKNDTKKGRHCERSEAIPWTATLPHLDLA
jgi:hypothetical protein